MSQLRWHPFLQEWVAVAAHRQVRPISLARGAGPATGPPCPFCPGGAEGLNGPYDIVTFENKFPSMVRTAPEVREGGPGDLYRRVPGKGICEVVLYSPNHGTTLAEEPAGQIEKLVEVWADRYREIGAHKYIKYVYIFENKGAIIGVTLTHPHGQIYAFPFIPPKAAAELAAEKRYRSRHGRCMMCDIDRKERKFRKRLVAANRHFSAWIPYFARYPYELYVVPRRHLGSLPEMKPPERKALAAILKKVIAKYDNLFGFSFPYIMLMHQSPTDGKPHRYHHFHVEFYPPHRSRDKIKYLAGCESGAGMFINDTIAEEKAAELRSCKPR